MSSSRYPVDVKAVGLMQCGKQKKYMMSVSWSDQNKILIYRTFEDFKTFHKELKRKFPIESGSLRRSDRTIPRFKVPLLSYTNFHRKSGKMNWCLEILKLLETYSQELLKTEAKISQGGDVIQFFKAQTQDLDPSFPENSVVIMPSEIGGGKKNQPGPQLSITRPQVSQSYRCIEAFETKDTKNQKFKVATKEIVEVLIKDMTGWWLVENADKQIAWFPAPYLEEIDAHKDIEKVLSSLYFVVRDYESQKADELSLNNGVVVEVVKKSDDGWWLIRERNSRLNWKPELSRSLPEVEQARSSPLEHTLAMHSSKSPHLTHKDRNDSGFVESSAGDLSHSLTDPDLATCVPKVPVRPSAHEILQKCSTMTKRAVQKSSTRPALQTLLPSVH
uniref:NADPH oxidase organizer 1 n=1 Tax=Calidris pygmaea TaxID=425635 RepID=A0A8C3PR64_9CHAR